MVHIDFLTVVVAAIIYMIIKIFWYSTVMFGEIMEDLKDVRPDEVTTKIIAYPLNFLVALILAYFISLIEIYVGATSFWDGIVAGFVLWLGFVFTTQITTVIWVKDSYKIFLIKNGFLLVAFMVMGAVLVG